MRCSECGREPMNQEANFCDYCGNSFRRYGDQGWQTEETMKKETKTQGYSAFGMPGEEDETQGATYHTYGQTAHKEYASGGAAGKVTSVGTYLAAMLSMFIPYVGVYLFLGILAYWGFGSKVSSERKNFARALLIFAVILVVFTVIGLSYMMQNGDLNSILEQMGIS